MLRSLFLIDLPTSYKIMAFALGAGLARVGRRGRRLDFLLWSLMNEKANAAIFLSHIEIRDSSMNL